MCKARLARAPAILGILKAIGFALTLLAMARNLTSKVIVITGGSSGIGEATALRAAEAGMDVVLAARRTERLTEVAAPIRHRGRAVLTVPCDVTNWSDNERLFEQAWDRFGRVDVVFANAGYGMFGSVLDTPMADHRAIFEVNYFGTLHTLQAGAPYLRSTDSGLKQMLICSSAGSELALPMFGAYAATKAAQKSIGGALRAELADEGMTVTTVHPVGTKTPFFDTARERSPVTEAGDPSTTNTPPGLMQSSRHVAKTIVAAIRRPKPEVWPMRSSRWALALSNALPRVTACAMRRHYHRIRG